MIVGKPGYLKSLLTDRFVASVTPSSNYTSRRITRKIDFDKAELVVEFGPGTGILSQAFLSQMREDTRLILVETNAKFVEALQEMKEPQIEVVKGNALNIEKILEERGSLQADYIISGVPLSFLSREQRYQLVQASYNVLKPGGKLIIYQFSWTAKEYILSCFQDAKTEFELLNVPPLIIYEAVKD